MGLEEGRKGQWKVTPWMFSIEEASALSYARQERHRSWVLSLCRGLRGIGMQRLRGGSSRLSFLSAPLLRKKALNSWAAVQDTYLSTKVTAYIRLNYREVWWAIHGEVSE